MKAIQISLLFIEKEEWNQVRGIMVLSILNSPLISLPDRIFIGHKSDHCLPLSLKFLKLKFGRDSEADLLKWLKSNYFGERTHTLGSVWPLAMFKHGQRYNGSKSWDLLTNELPKRDTNKLHQNNHKFWQKYCKMLVFVQNLSPSCCRTWQY